MLYEIKENEKMERLKSKWNPKELEIENFILSSVDENNILDASIFGEPLLVISNQVKTRLKKRADILAIDCYGNGVVIELKRDWGYLGVETQALQYLADFSAYKGNKFIQHFSKYENDIKQKIESFIDSNAPLEDINKTSRVILVARGFDATIYSMGEWLSNNGVAFRCIQYQPCEIDNKRFLSFSISFDRSKDILNPLAFGTIAREPRYYWHNIAKADQKWWELLVSKKQIPACFDSMPGDEGERILKGYIAGDTIIAYASGHGAVGWGVIEKPGSYCLIEKGSSEDYLDGDCMHRLSINWKATAEKLKENAIKAKEVRDDFGIYHPMRTSVSIDSAKAKELINALNQQ